MCPYGVENYYRACRHTAFGGHPLRYVLVFRVNDTVDRHVGKEVGGSSDVEARASSGIIRANSYAAVFENGQAAADNAGRIDVESAIRRLRESNGSGWWRKLQERGRIDSNAH